MRQSSVAAITLAAVAMAAPTSAAMAQMQSQRACAQIRAACLAAGFVQGAARDGVGLQVHCVMPIMMARPQPPSARRPLPKVGPQLVADCQALRASRFGRAWLPEEVVLPPSEVTAPPAPAPASPSATSSIRAPRAAGQNVVVRPPMPMTSEQRSLIAALPPEDQPETGPAKALPPQFRRTMIDYASKEPAGTIVIDTPHTYLYLVLGNGKAMRYGIGVGRDGFTWSGTEKITRTAEWPDWNPPEEMIARQPYLPRFMAGGEGNPLGARALYLGQTLYRIHGTNQPSTIGTFVSSGCIRLTNEDIIDLYGRVQVGTRVVVAPGSSTGPAQAAMSAKPATPPRPRAKTEKPAAAPAAVAEKPAAAPAAPPQAAPPPAASEVASKDTPKDAGKGTTSSIARARAAPVATAAPVNEEE